MRRFLLATVVMGLAVIPAYAASTPWMTVSQMRAYMNKVMKKDIYPTAIQCKAGAGKTTLVRFTTRPAFTPKPFFKYQFVVAPTAGLAAAVAKVPTPEKPELKYRIVSQADAGNGSACALVYR